MATSTLRALLPYTLLGAFLLASCSAPSDLTQPPALETQAVLPSGFNDALITSVAKPTALAFTPDGRMLITTQDGKLYVLKNGALTLARTIRVICTNSERGLLGVTVDPQFAQNRYIYLYYTANKSGTCAQNTSQSPVNRVIRFVLPDNNIISPNGPTVLINNIPSPNGNHNGGDLSFGNDGLLYVSVGDGGCDYERNSGCGAANDAARGRHTLVGKILRVTKTGGVPAGNPFQGTNSVRCNVSGRTTSGRVCREIYASGLRNPFRFVFDPNVSTTRFFINDVGQNAREEIDLGAAGADYGWNLREGACATGSTNCGTPSAGLTNPVFDWGHTDSGIFNGCRSITGGAFVPNGLWPSAYNGAYLFGDFICGKVFMLTPSEGGLSASVFASDLGGGSAVHLSFGTYNGERSLYYTTYAGGGQVRRISYTGN